MVTETLTLPQTQPAKSASGLRSQCLSSTEVLGQAIANIAPSATPALVIPLVFATAGNGTWLAYLFALVAIVLVGASLNQFTRRSASPGSLYSFIARGLGPSVGVVAGWTLVLAYLLTASAVICGFVNYGNVLLAYAGVGPSPVLSVVLALLGAASAWWVAYKDIKLSTKLMLGLELISLAIIILLAVIVLVRHGTHFDLAQLSLQHVNADSIRIGLVLAFFSFTGFESPGSLGDEAKNPLRTIPRSITISAIFVGLIFVLLSYTEVQGFIGSATTLDKAAAPLADLATSHGVGFFGPLISIGALISFWACILACVNAGARVLFAMGRHRVFHDAVGNAHATNDTPHIAVTISALIATIVPVILIALKNGLFDIYGWVGTVATFGFLLNYLLIAVAAPFYLKHEKELKGKHVVLAVITVLVLLIPLVGSVYPLPAMPYTLFPFIFLGWLVAGIVWYVIRQIGSNVSSDITEELDAVHARYHDIRLQGDGEGI